MTDRQQRIDDAYQAAYDDLIGQGMEDFLSLPLATLLYRFGKRMYDRGTSDGARREREDAAPEPIAFRSPPTSPPFVSAEFKGGRLVIDGQEIIPDLEYVPAGSPLGEVASRTPDGLTFGSDGPREDIRV